jgi:hypothetical protein
MATQVKACRLSFQAAVLINPRAAALVPQEQVVIRLTPRAQAIINRIRDKPKHHPQPHEECVLVSLIQEVRLLLMNLVVVDGDYNPKDNRINTDMILEL